MTADPKDKSEDVAPSEQPAAAAETLLADTMRAGAAPVVALSGEELAFAVTLPVPSSRVRDREAPLALRERYEDIKFLGEGGMGTVYRGRDPRLGRTVALKLLKGDDPELWRRFLQEARAQARIQHDNVCRVYEAGEVGGEPYIAMQFVDGQPLDRLKEKITLEQKVKIIREIAAAVHEAHRLGLIHRDIKPGNILVETNEDGTFKPYIMDFGLARETKSEGHTVTGAVLGTPAYMAPEQARGEVHALDRRTDVYSLGATLYDLLAGRPPFLDEHAWKLLMKVAYEEAQPIRTVKKEIPEELETIVMKCLEREQSMRYDSARALGDDLQRFLDGEPISARRASVSYVLLKRARKHKLAVGFVAAAIVAATSFLGVWVKARRDAAEQARFAQELGEDVKEMELFLRSAYELPLHDVERERDVVRARLLSIEGRMAEAGKVGEGPGHYALGRGYLALGDPERAEDHLEKARAAGYSSAELAYALGRALGEIYKRALEDTKRIQNEKERKAKVEEIEKKYRDPALVELRAGAAARLEAPVYVEGLVAFYEGKYEDALVKAKEASAKAPWLYEAKKLEGDAHFALGSRFRHDAAFDWDKMMTDYGPGAEAYRVASEIARSDPEVYRAECELWTQRALSDHSHGQSPTMSFESAGKACEGAVAASSIDRGTRVQRALLLALRAGASAESGGEDTVSAARVAGSAAEVAVAASPSDPMAHYTLARSLSIEVDERSMQGIRLPADRARAAFEEALRLDPLFTWAINELGDVYMLESDFCTWQGKDPTQALNAAMEQYDHAAAQDATFSLPLLKKAAAQMGLMWKLHEAGRLTEEYLAERSRAVEVIVKQSAGQWLATFWGARVSRLRAHDEFARGRDPTAVLASAVASIEKLGDIEKADYWVLREIADLYSLEARYALRTGKDPGSALRVARDAAERTVRAKPAHLEPRVIWARVELYAARSAVLRKEATSSHFNAAFEPLKPLLDKERDDPKLYQTLADIHALRASWLLGEKKSPDADIEAGLEMADKALAKNPHMAAALAAKGALLLVRARAEKDPKLGKEAATKARDAFDAAFKENPTLERDSAAERKDAAERATQPG